MVLCHTFTRKCDVCGKNITFMEEEPHPRDMNCYECENDHFMCSKHIPRKKENVVYKNNDYREALDILELSENPEDDLPTVASNMNLDLQLLKMAWDNFDDIYQGINLPYCSCPICIKNGITVKQVKQFKQPIPSQPIGKMGIEDVLKNLGVKL